MAVSGDPPPLRERAAPASRLVRRLRLLIAGARAATRADRAETALERSGLTTRRVGMGDRNGGYELALSGRRVRRAPEQVVVGQRGSLRPTMLEQIVTDAGDGLGDELVTGAVRVLAAGTVMADVRGQRHGAFLLRVEPHWPAPDDPLERLLSCAPPAVVTSRLVVPRLRGLLAGHSWSLEERQPGTHPRQVTPALWAQCSGFLEALGTVSAPRGHRAPRSLDEDLGVVEPLLAPEQAKRLRAGIEQVSNLLEGVPRGWGHGDFHPANLLVRDGLETVLDWDAASPSALPLLDLLHLYATAAPAARRSPHGVRCRDILWPLARAGGDAWMREHCAARGLDSDPRVLEALAVAYWLTRVARDLTMFPDRQTRVEWLQLNVVEPARALAARG